MSQKRILNHGEQPANDFEAAIKAKLAEKKADAQRRSRAAARIETTELARHTRAEQTLPIRRAAAEAAAAIMRADAKKFAQAIKQNGGPAPIRGKLKEGSQLTDSSRRDVGYEYPRSRLFRSDATVFKVTSEEIDVWLVTKSEKKWYVQTEEGGPLGGGGITNYSDKPFAAGGSKHTRTSGLAVTSDGELVHYHYYNDGRGYNPSASGVNIKDQPVTDIDIAPIEHAGENGVYNPNVIEQWRAQLLANI